jgi:hypothetical protein
MKTKKSRAAREKNSFRQKRNFYGSRKICLPPDFPLFSILNFSQDTEHRCVHAQKISFGSRVTRLGEFSPIGRLFTLGSFVENYRRMLKFLATFFLSKRHVLILTKNALGYILGDFFHKPIWSPCLDRLLRFRHRQVSENSRQAICKKDLMYNTFILGRYVLRMIEAKKWFTQNN